MAQDPSLVPDITVAENVLLGHEGAAMRFGIVRWHELMRRARAALCEIDPALQPAARTLTLSPQQRQLVAFARALAFETRAREHAPILLLDEPTSALDDRRRRSRSATIERLRTQASVVLVSHRLEEVVRVCDRIYVMKDGSCVGERDARTCTSTETLQRPDDRDTSTRRQASHSEAARSQAGDRVAWRCDS